MAKTFCVPVLFKGREIDSIRVLATSATKAKVFAKPEYANRGYYRMAGFTLGKPVKDAVREGRNDG